jgi:hypothetical protein
MRIGVLLAAFACGGQPMLSVGGTYDTAVSLDPQGNTCGDVQVQDNLTEVAHAQGASTLSLIHAGVTYAGTVEPSGAFTIPPAPHVVGGATFVISAAGEFKPRGFTANVAVQDPRQCGYGVRWSGTKRGDANTLPTRR